MEISCRDVDESHSALRKRSAGGRGDARHKSRTCKLTGGTSNASESNSGENNPGTKSTRPNSTGNSAHTLTNTKT